MVAIGAIFFGVYGFGCTHFFYFTEVKQMAKKVIVLMLIATMLFGITACSANPTGTTDDRDKEKQTESTTIPITTDLPTTTELPTTTVPTTEMTTSVMDLGFYNLSDFKDEYGNCLLVGITGYSKSDGGYIYFNVNDTGLLFYDGFLQKIYYLTYDSSSGLSYERGRGPYSYSVISNDGISYAGESTVIYERVSINNKAVIFKTDSTRGEAWYIPASMIDWSTKEEDFEANDGYHYTRYFLK